MYAHGQPNDFGDLDLEDIWNYQREDVDFPPPKKLRAETSASSQHSLLGLIEATLKQELNDYIIGLCEEEGLDEFDDDNLAQLYQVLTADTGAIRFSTRKECRKLYTKRFSTGTLPPDFLSGRSLQNSAEKSSKSFGLIDQRGSGKTKSVKIWSLKALKTTSCVLKNARPGPSYLFMISIQDIDFSRETTLLECLLSTCLPDWNHDLESDRRLLNSIVNDENVVIIFDDIRNLPDCSTRVSGVLLHGRAKPQIFILNILSNNLLQKAKKIVICHPLAFYQINPIYRPDSIFSLGTSSDSFHDWIDHNIPQNAEKLYSFCRNYVNSKWSQDYIQNLPGDSWLFVNILVYNLKQYTLSWPDSVKQDVYKVARLAWIGIKAKIVYYTYCEGLNDQVVATFFHTFLPERVCSSTFMGTLGLVYSFPDIILQEFFAAFHLAFSFPPEEFNNILPLLCQDRFKVVRLFLFGLCNKETLRDLQDFFPGIPSQLCKIKKSVVKKISISLMNKVLNLTDNFNKLKHVCQCVYESQDSEILEAVVEYFPECLNMVFDNMSIIDARQIAYVLKASKQRHILKINEPDYFETGLFDEILKFSVKINKWELVGAYILNYEAGMIGEHLGNAEELKLKCCHFQENALEKLVDAIPDNKVLKKIEVSSIKGQPDYFGLKNCIKHVQILILSNSDIDFFAVEFMAAEIDKLRQPLEKLDLSLNNLKDEGAVQLSKCVRNIKVLNVSSCKIGTKGIEKLAKKIRALTIPMEKLSISGNEIGNAGAMFLASCIFNIDKLHAETCDFGGKGVKALAEKISVRLSAIKCLNLSHNSIKAKGALALGKCIHNVAKLKLEHCKINAQMLHDICKNIPDIHKKAKSLVLSNNEIRDEGAFTLAECMHNLDNLRIANCGIEGNGAKAISNQIYTRQIPMYCLDLSSNDLFDSGTVHLAKSVSKVKRLHLSSCKLTLIGARALAEHIAQLHNPMELLNLSFNSISDEGANQLASCLYNLEQLHLNHCSLHDSSLTALLGPKSTLNSMHYLGLKGNKFSDESVQCICGSLCKVQKMDLVSCGLPISAKIQIKSQLEEFNLHENRVLLDEGSRDVNLFQDII